MSLEPYRCVFVLTELGEDAVAEEPELYVGEEEEDAMSNGENFFMKKCFLADVESSRR